MNRAQQYIDRFNEAVKNAGGIAAYMAGQKFNKSKSQNTQGENINSMEQITLILAPQHLRPLRHICRANYESIMGDPDASTDTKNIAADLYHRVMLLHNAVNAAEIASNTWAKYDRYVMDSKPATIHANRPRKPVQIDTNDTTTTEENPLEQAQELPQMETEAASTSSADVVKRTI